MSPAMPCWRRLQPTQTQPPSCPCYAACMAPPPRTSGTTSIPTPTQSCKAMEANKVTLALHTALTSISPHLQPGETRVAYLDDLYVVSTPHRTVPIFNLLQANLDAHAGISLHLGKTRVWNAAGEEPTDIHLLQPTPPAAPIWTGNWALPTNAQGRLARQTRRTSSAPDRDPYC